MQREKPAGEDTPKRQVVGIDILESGLMIVLWALVNTMVMEGNCRVNGAMVYLMGSSKINQLEAL